MTRPENRSAPDWHAYYLHHVNTAYRRFSATMRQFRADMRDIAMHSAPNITTDCGFVRYSDARNFADAVAFIRSVTGE